MSYNPSRVDSNKNFQRHSPPPGSGLAHSDIVRKNQAPSFMPVGSRVVTQHGYMIPIFECESFKTRYEVFYSRNATGTGVNPSGDRTIMVLRGSIYADVELENGVFETVKLQEGHSLNVPRGKKHALATSGVDNAELFITETVDYEKTWEQISPPTIGNEIVLPELQMQSAPTVVRRGNNPVTMQQAEDIKEQAITRRQRASVGSTTAPAGNANSANTIGVSPRPGGFRVEE